MRTTLPDLGDLLFGVAVLFGVLIVIFECAERRRASRREQRILELIEREYEAFYQLGRL